MSRPTTRRWCWIQIVPLISIPVLVLMFSPRYSRQGLLAVALAWYVLAKAAEFGDAAIFAATNETVSGHTLKHALAALACLTVLVMLSTRRQTGSQTPGGSA